jgi:hypothetical protein
MTSVSKRCYDTMHLDESQSYDLKRTVEIIYYRGLREATEEDPDPAAKSYAYTSTF